MKEKWDGMSNEELCIEYQQTNNNELFEYFVNRNRGLINYFIQVTVNKYPSYKDVLIQYGYTAMWDAMLHFDNTRGAKFPTLYYFYLLKSLRNFYEEALDIRLPAYVTANYADFKEKHKDDNFVFDVLSLNNSPNCLSYENDREVTLLDLIESDENLEADMEAKLTREELITYAKRLNARAAACIIDYYGLEDGVPKTLQTLGDKYGVTRERIRQIVSKGLKKIKIWYMSDHPVD